MSKLRKNPCAFGEAGWTQDAVSLQCSSPRDVYHCISNEKDRLVELCIQPVWVNPRKYKNIFVTLYVIIVPYFLINSFYVWSFTCISQTLTYLYTVLFIFCWLLKRDGNKNETATKTLHWCFQYSYRGFYLIYARLCNKKKRP